MIRPHWEWPNVIKHEGGHLHYWVCVGVGVSVCANRKCFLSVPHFKSLIMITDYFKEYLLFLEMLLLLKLTLWMAIFKGSSGRGCLRQFKHHWLWCLPLGKFLPAPLPEFWACLLTGLQQPLTSHWQSNWIYTSWRRPCHCSY